MNDEQFRRNAAEAEELAANAKSETARERWRRIARGWLGMLRKPTAPGLAHSKPSDPPETATRSRH